MSPCMRRIVPNQILCTDSIRNCYRNRPVPQFQEDCSQYRHAPLRALPIESSYGFRCRMSCCMHQIDPIGRVGSSLGMPACYTPCSVRSGTCCRRKLRPWFAYVLSSGFHLRTSRCTSQMRSTRLPRNSPGMDPYCTQPIGVYPGKNARE